MDLVISGAWSSYLVNLGYCGLGELTIMTNELERLREDIQ
jgi:hypothetical protein